MKNFQASPKPVICIVENNYSNLKLLSILLRENNYEFVVAHSTEAAINTLQNISVELILINLTLKDKLQICQFVQTSESTKNIPIIFMGANQNDTDQVRQLNIENLDNTRMPIQVDDVLTKIKCHLQIHSLKKQLQYQNQKLQQEISLRKKVENELKEQKLMLGSLIENLPGIVYYSSNDCNLNMNFVSDNFYSMTGYQSEELIQNQIIYNQLICPEDRKYLWQKRQKALVNNQPFQLIYQIITAKKELKWVWEQGKGVYCSNGEVLAIKGLIIDITNQKQVESELTKQNLALQKAEAALIVANQQLQKVARLDGLTGIANRRYFDEYLEKEWRRLTRTKLPLSLILCDVDYFKYYNDYYGHLAGDDCLQKIAQTIKKTVKRSADLVARYGGEEFAIILPNTSGKNAEKVVELIRTAIHKLQINHSTSRVSKYVTMSMGIASVTPTKTESSQSLIAKADEALYNAKEKGRDRIIFFNQDCSKGTQTYLNNNLSYRKSHQNITQNFLPALS
ncbi:MAG: diguanylate cyclase [Okeania sp. SIO3I5]|uniref:diguanylate cyclase domain-containing protein n=1 Tax=Okeania sp. SIO3I5 TaxID=2607805 RepID=UPI0013B5CAC6|nr:diguanylate cyclase [Okeania sp. SIO3I5]NEQ40921.1 diguanylate cyclase [Okeania sp. SIO3I5]